MLEDNPEVCRQADLGPSDSTLLSLFWRFNIVFGMDGFERVPDTHLEVYSPVYVLCIAPIGQQPIPTSWKGTNRKALLVDWYEAYLDAKEKAP